MTSCLPNQNYSLKLELESKTMQVVNLEQEIESLRAKVLENEEKLVESLEKSSKESVKVTQLQKELQKLEAKRHKDIKKLKSKHDEQMSWKTLTCESLKAQNAALLKQVGITQEKSALKEKELQYRIESLEQEVTSYNDLSVAVDENLEQDNETLKVENEVEDGGGSKKVLEEAENEKSHEDNDSDDGSEKLRIDEINEASPEKKEEMLSPSSPFSTNSRRRFRKINHMGKLFTLIENLEKVKSCLEKQLEYNNNFIEAGGSGNVEILENAQMLEEAMEELKECIEEEIKRLSQAGGSYTPDTLSLVSSDARKSLKRGGPKIKTQWGKIKALHNMTIPSMIYSNDSNSTCSYDYFTAEEIRDPMPQKKDYFDLFKLKERKDIDMIDVVNRALQSYLHAENLANREKDRAGTQYINAKTMNIDFIQEFNVSIKYWYGSLSVKGKKWDPSDSLVDIAFAFSRGLIGRRQGKIVYTKQEFATDALFLYVLQQIDPAGNWIREFLPDNENLCMLQKMNTRTPWLGVVRRGPRVFVADVKDISVFKKPLLVVDHSTSLNASETLPSSPKISEQT